MKKSYSSFFAFFLSYLVNTSFAFPIGPRKFFVFGLPFTGVQYVERLLDAANFSPSTLSDCSGAEGGQSKTDSGAASVSDIELTCKYEPFGWNKLLQNLNNNCKANETLFILVTKDPYAWLSSVARRRYKSSEQLRIHIID